VQTKPVTKTDHWSLNEAGMLWVERRDPSQLIENLPAPLRTRSALCRCRRAIYQLVRLLAVEV